MHDILVSFWERLVSFKVGKDIQHRTCWQLRIQVNHGNLRVAALLFSSGGSQEIYRRNSLRNPLQQVPCNELQTQVLFLANISLTPWILWKLCFPSRGVEAEQQFLPPEETLFSGLFYVGAKAKVNIFVFLGQRAQKVFNRMPLCHLHLCYRHVEP